MYKKKLDILVATYNLAGIGGTESYSFAIIEELIKHGHDVEYFTFKKGLTSGKIEQELGVVFYTKRKYDLILANHNSVVSQLLNKGFIIQTTHGIFSQLEFPNKLANAIVSISEEVKKFLETKGIENQLILNGINLDRFISTSLLNDQLTNVLSLSQSEIANKKIQEACKILKLNFSKINKFTNPVFNIEEKINQADIVIGVGRSLYDAFACGRPCIVFDERSYMGGKGDGYLTKENIYKSIQNNCSGRYFNYHFSTEDLVYELNKFHKLDGQYLREFAVKNLNIKAAVSSYLEIYYKQAADINKLNFFRKKKVFIRNYIHIKMMAMKNLKYKIFTVFYSILKKN